MKQDFTVDENTVVTVEKTTEKGKDNVVVSVRINGVEERALKVRSQFRTNDLVEVVGIELEVEPV